MAEQVGAEADFFSVVGTQRAMRRLKPDPVPEEHIKRIIWAATRAPSGGNRQPWRFLVVTDAAKRKALAAVYREGWERYRASGYGGSAGRELAPEWAESNEKVLRSSQYLADHMEEVPVLIFPCIFGGGPKDLTSGSSIYPAIQNLMLAARALGLGTALTTIHRWNEPRVREILGIPETVDTAALIPVGWPKGKFGAGLRQPVEAVTYWDSWGAKRP